MNIIDKIFNKNIGYIVGAIFLVEILSFFCNFIYIGNAVFFIILCGITIYYTWQKLEYGVFIALTELMIGSKGYLFNLGINDFKVSIRLAIFIIIFMIWLIKYFNFKKYWALLKEQKIFQIFIILLAFIGIGVLNGIWHKNGLKEVFFDFNGYLYILLFPAFLELFLSQKQLICAMQVLFATIITSSIKIFLVLYAITHNIPTFAISFYKWIRDTGVGEITPAGNNFYRIFFQSQIFSLAGIFIIIFLLAYLIQQNKNKLLTDKNLIKLSGILILAISSILISFSRSYWLGLVISGIILLIILLIKIKFKELFKLSLIVIATAISSIILIIIITMFPIPPVSGGFSASMLSDRFLAISGEAGVSSRWNLLPIIFAENLKHPLLGTGFGTTLTYQTDDLRIKNSDNPEGWYTTYTFEWGYLDTITEIGIFGLLAYLIFIFKIFYNGYQKIKKTADIQAKYLIAGFLLGLVALLVTNSFSPYLNHPLGIGYLILTLSMIYAIM